MSNKHGDPFKRHSGIFKYMDCSTCHITKDVSESIMSIESLSVDPHEFGWWMFVPELIEPDVPQCLRDILFYASGADARWVKLDVDGYTYDSLPKYNW